MIPLSSRFALAALALLLVAAVPVWTRTEGVGREDCRDPEALLDLTAITPDSDPTLRLTPTIRHSFKPHAYYSRPGGDPLEYSYPEHRIEVRSFEMGDEVVPVHWGTDQSHTVMRLRAYTFAHGGRPTTHPLPSGLAMLGTQAVDGTRPVTVLMIDGVASIERGAELERRASRWIETAWHHYRQSCER